MSIHHLITLILYPVEYLPSEQQRNKNTTTSPRSHIWYMLSDNYAEKGFSWPLRCVDPLSSHRITLPLMSEEKNVYGGKGQNVTAAAGRTLPEHRKYCLVSANIHTCSPAFPACVCLQSGGRRLSVVAHDWNGASLCSVF